MVSPTLGGHVFASSTNAVAFTVGAPLLFPGPVFLASIACVDGDTCYVIGRAHTYSGPGELFTLTDGTVTNQQTLTGADFMFDLACSPDGACDAIGRDSFGSGPALVLPISNGAPGAIQTVDGVATLTGIACSGSGACYAVGAGADPSASGVIVPIVDGGIGPVVSVSGAAYLTDVDCPTADTCYAIGSGGGDSATVVVPVVDGQPGATQDVQGGGFSAIACPSADTCYAVGYAGGPASTNHGQGNGGFVAIVDGQPGPVQTVDGAGPLTRIACPTSSRCLAFGMVHAPPIGSTGNLPISLSGAVVPIMDGVAGSMISGIGMYGEGPGRPSDYVTSADCPNSQTCYALTRDGIIPITVGGDDTLPVLTGAYYVPGQALAGPTLPNASAVLQYTNGQWTEAPLYFPLSAGG